MRSWKRKRQCRGYIRVVIKGHGDLWLPRFIRRYSRSSYSLRESIRDNISLVHFILFIFSFCTHSLRFAFCTNFTPAFSSFLKILKFIIFQLKAQKFSHNFYSLLNILRHLVIDLISPPPLHPDISVMFSNLHFANMQYAHIYTIILSISKYLQHDSKKYYYYININK